jgi:hypothetical protein
MPTYKETVIEESRKRAGEVLGQIQHLRRQVEGLEREYGEINSVLKALGAENALGVQAMAASRVIEWDEEQVVEVGGGRHNCSRKLMAEILALKEFRTGSAVDILQRSTKYAGKSHEALCQYANFYIAALLKQEAVVRMKRGHYAAVRKELPGRPEPRVREDIPEGDGEGIYIVDGAMTCEKPEGKR